jgi:hypothetical protein
VNTPSQPTGTTDFILQESPMSRDIVTIAKGNKLAAGAVVMQQSDGRYAPIDMKLRTLPAVLCAAVDATLTDKKVHAIVRDATLDTNGLVMPTTFGINERQGVASYLQSFLMRRFWK